MSVTDSPADPAGEALELRARLAHVEAELADARRLSAELARWLEGEVRGGLAGVVATAELLQRQPLSLDGAAHVRTILDAGRGLGRDLDEAMRRLRPVSSGAAPGAPTITAVIDALESAWRVEAERAGARLIVSCEGLVDEPLEVEAGWLEPLIGLLIGDALAASPGGVVELRCCVKAAGDRGLTVEAGVRRTGGGDGPNLAAARAMAAALGGEVLARDNAGAGGEVRLRLTVARAPQTASASAEDASIGVPERPAVQAHVLIVDDNATNRMVAEALCDMFGCSCETAEDGVEALEAVRARAFDLVLMDIRMPRMDGVEATRAIRALGGAAGDTPIVALTANGDPEAVRTYLAAGMDSFVEKPIKAERLLEAIGSALTCRRPAPSPGSRAAA